jgi:hypothetical protein
MEDGLICPKCITDEFIEYDLFYTNDDVPYDGAYCSKCKTMVWSEET